MSDLEKLAHVISNILGTDNKVRKECEKILQEVKKRDNNTYFQLILQLLKESQDQRIRSFCAVMLRKQLSAFSEKNFEPAWYDINEETAKFIKSEIFVALVNEPTNLVRNQICDFIAELGGTILNIDEELEEGAKKLPKELKTWDKLMDLILELWVSKREKMMESAMRILSTLFTYVNDDLLKYSNDFFAMFKNGLEFNDLGVKSATLESLGSWLEAIDAKDAKMFEDLIPIMMETLLFILAKDQLMGIDALGRIIDIIEYSPKFFRKNFNYLFGTVKKIVSVKEVETESVKQMALQILYTMMQRSPKVFSDNYIKELLEMFFAHIIETAEEATEEWMNPKEGYNEHTLEEVENEGTKFGTHGVEKMLIVFGSKEILPTLSTLVQAMLVSPDWRFKYSALMALAGIGEHLESMDDVAPIVELVFKFFKDSNPRIRYAAFHLIGQMSDDCQPEFQTKFHNKVVPNLLSCLDEKVPRVLAHVFGAITNHFEGMISELTNIYLKDILPAIFPFVKTGSSFVRENALCAITAAAESARTYYRPYFEESVPIIYEILKTHSQPEYKQLRGQCIESITLMGFSVGKEYFMKFASEIIDLLVYIQKNDLAADSLDPQRSYVLSGWQRICLILEEEFVPYLSVVLPSLFKVIENLLRDRKEEESAVDEASSLALFATTDGKSQQKELEKKQVTNTFEHEEVESALGMLYVFITELGPHYIDYVDSTANLLIRALNFSNSEKVRRHAIKSLGPLLVVVKQARPDNKELLVKYANIFLDQIWKCTEAEAEAEELIHCIHGIIEIVEVCGRFMTLAELEIFSVKTLGVLASSDSRKADNQTIKGKEDCDEDEIEALDGDTDQEENLHVAVAELIGMLFKTHKELTLGLAALLYSDVLAKVLSPTVSDKMHKFGLYIIDDMIEHLGIELIPNEWPALSEALIKYATDKTPYVRQAAIYGIGMLAIKSKDAFNLIAEVCLVKIIEALKRQKGENEHPKQFDFAREAAIAALGKIISSGAKVNVNLLIPEWVNLLPMQKDKPEGRKQHDLLTELILRGNAALVLGENGERVGKVISIFAIILQTKLSNPEIEKKIVQILKFLITDEKTKPLVANATKNLTLLQKQRLEDVLKAHSD